MGDVSYGAANRKLLLIHHSTVTPPPSPWLVIGPSACKQKIPNYKPHRIQTLPQLWLYAPPLIWIYRYYDILKLNLRLVYAKRVLFSTGIACFKGLFPIPIICLPLDVSLSVLKSSYNLFLKIYCISPGWWLTLVFLKVDVVVTCYWNDCF